MTDSEITTALLRQLREDIAKTNQKVDAMSTAMNSRFDSIDKRLDDVDDRLFAQDYILRDVQVHVLSLSRIVKQKQPTVIEDLRKRVSKLEKKGG